MYCHLFYGSHCILCLCKTSLQQLCDSITVVGNLVPFKNNIITSTLDMFLYETVIFYNDICSDILIIFIAVYFHTVCWYVLHHDTDITRNHLQTKTVFSLNISHIPNCCKFYNTVISTNHQAATECKHYQVLSTIMRFVTSPSRYAESNQMDKCTH